MAETFYEDRKGPPPDLLRQHLDKELGAGGPLNRLIDLSQYRERYPTEGVFDEYLNVYHYCGSIEVDGQRIGGSNSVRGPLSRAYSMRIGCFGKRLISMITTHCKWRRSLSVWRMEDLNMRCGPILHFETAYSDPGKGSGLWAEGANKLLAKHGKGCGLLILHAHPSMRSGRDEDADFEFRRKTMMKHYRVLFNVEAFPGKAGTNGWMWKPIHPTKNHVEPRVRRGKWAYPDDELPYQGRPERG